MIRTATVDGTQAAQMLDLFGTLSNVYRRLNLKKEMSYSAFYRAMQCRTVTPKHRNVIIARWMKWKSEYLVTGATKKSAGRERFQLT